MASIKTVGWSKIFARMQILGSLSQSQTTIFLIEMKFKLRFFPDNESRSSFYCRYSKGS